MQVTLEVQSGPDSRRVLTITPGPAVQVGRKAPSHLVIGGDPSLSRVHFSVECDGATCRLRDLESTSGTIVNDVPATDAILHDGDRIEAGATVFVVRIDGAPASPRRRPPLATAPAAIPDRSDEATRDLPTLEETPRDRALARLRREPAALFAVLDAARHPLIVALIHGKERYQSLYDGAKGDQLGFVAPYLVSLPPQSPLLDTLVRQGWGESWGLYFTCDQPFEEVRKHLRRFLKVKTEEGKGLYFRYYDPRVLRTFLPTCTEAELAEFFGPIRRFLMEDADPDTLLQFEREGSRLKPQAVPLGAKPESAVAPRMT